MARTSGTRKGNGQGMGEGHGPAHGVRGAFAVGNPGGPGAGNYSVDKAARAAATQARLERIRDQDENLNAAVAAAKTLLGYDIGLPVQTTINANVDGIANLSGEQLDALLAAAERASAGGLGGSAAQGEGAAGGRKPH